MCLGVICLHKTKKFKAQFIKKYRELFTMTCSIKVPVIIRRYDLSDNPTMQQTEIELNPKMEYADLKKVIQNYFDISDEDSKVIKIRNKDYALIPMMSLLEHHNPKIPYIIDISKITLANEGTANLLQDAYLDAVRQKLRSMESRVSQAEVLLPQLQWRRQSHLDHTVNTLSNRVAFLNRRIDELMPVEWKSKMPETIS